MVISSSLNGFRRGFRHPWHLVRCDCCRKMILNAVPKCPNCAAWRMDARVFSVGFAVLVSAAAIGIVFWGAAAANQAVKKNAERHEEVIQLIQQRNAAGSQASW